MTFDEGRRSSKRTNSLWAIINAWYSPWVVPNKISKNHKIIQIMNYFILDFWLKNSFFPTPRHKNCHKAGSWVRHQQRTLHFMPMRFYISYLPLVSVSRGCTLWISSILFFNQSYFQFSRLCCLKVYTLVWLGKPYKNIQCPSPATKRK